MIDKHSGGEFNPDYNIHPGDFLEEELESKGLKQSDLAKRTGLTNKTINTIIKGSASISPDTAVALETVLGKPAVYWLNLEAIYQVKKVNEAQEKLLLEDIYVLDIIDIKSMISKGWANKCDSKIEQLKELLSFFGVASVKQINSVWSKLEVNYRMSQAYQRNHLNIMAWLRRGELLAQEIECEPYNSKKFKNALHECRGFTNYSFEECSEKVKDVCAKAGVAVVFVPEIENIATSGAAHWLSKDKALIQLSLRGKSDDKFWFNFYHEAGHILLHGRKDQFIDNEGAFSSTDDDNFVTPDRKLIEAEADDFSSSMLISKKSFSEFIMRRDFKKTSIMAFSEQEDIAPGIIVGQLQNNEFIRWGTPLNKLKKKYEFPS